MSNWTPYNPDSFGLTGLYFWGAPLDDPNNMLAYPNQGPAGQVLHAKATVTLNLNDACIIDTANPGQTTKSTSGGVFLGVCVGYYQYHQTVFTSGPAAGQGALIQINGMAYMTAGSAITAGEALTFSATTAGRVIPLTSLTANQQIVGYALGSQATAGQPVLVSIGAAGLGASGSGPNDSVTVYNTPGTYSYTPPASATLLRVTLVGGGGGGGGGYTSTYHGGAGAPGGSVVGLFGIGSNAPFSVIVGASAAGGAGGASPANGTTGNVSSIEDTNSVNTVSAAAGTDGTGATSSANGTAGSAGSTTATVDGVVLLAVLSSSTSGGPLGGAGGADTGATGGTGEQGRVVIEAL